MGKKAWHLWSFAWMWVRGWVGVQQKIPTPKVGKFRGLLSILWHVWFLSVCFFVLSGALFYKHVPDEYWFETWLLVRSFLSFPPRLDGHISYFPLSTAKLFLVLMLLLEAWGHRCKRGRVEAQPQVETPFVSLLGNFPLLPPSPTRENAGFQMNPCMTKMKYVPPLTANFKSSAQ